MDKGKIFKGAPKPGFYTLKMDTQTKYMLCDSCEQPSQHVTLEAQGMKLCFGCRQKFVFDPALGRYTRRNRAGPLIKAWVK